MSIKYNMIRDINGFNGYGLPFCPDNSRSMLLAAGVAQSVTVPSNFECWVAVFSFPAAAKIWVADNHTAVAPTGAAAATTSQLNPNARFVKAGDVLSFITSDTTAEIGVSFYALSLNAPGAN